MSAKSELDIFSQAPPQVVVDSYAFEEIYPKDSISGYNKSHIEFDIIGSEDEYIDLNDTMLTIKIKAVDETGKDITVEIAKLTPSNYLFHCLFKDMTLFLNNTKIEDTNDSYYQKAIIETTLNMSTDTKKAFLKSMGYDEATERVKWLKKSALMTLCGPLNLDFFEQPKYLIPNVNLTIKIHRNDSNVIFLYEKTGTETEIKPQIYVDSAKLLIRRVRTTDSVRLAHSMGLDKQNAIYPIRKARIVQFSIPRGSHGEYKDNLFSDERLPKFVLITFQYSSKVSGEYSSYCSAFDNCNISSLTLSRGIDFRDVYKMDFEKNDYTETYFKSIILNMGLVNKNMNNGITMDDFKTKYPFFTFVLAPDFDVDQPQMPRTGNLKLDLRFHKALDVAVTMFVYGVFDGEIQIRKDGSVIA